MKNFSKLFMNLYHLFLEMAKNKKQQPKAVNSATAKKEKKDKNKDKEEKKVVVQRHRIFHLDFKERKRS